MSAGLRRLLLLGLLLSLQPAEAMTPCPPARQSLPLEANGARPPRPEADPQGLDYRDRLQSTAAGWPVRDHWCVWIEPPQEAPGSAAALREQQWRTAVLAGLSPWQELINITWVSEADQAQVRLWRRRPPLQRLGSGQLRASNGRSILALLLVDRGSGPAAEPRVEVLIDPGRAPQAIQATALHELGHAFGLWGHSDRSGDAMAISPGSVPVLQLSPRDRSTLRWLLSQPDRLQTPAAPAKRRPAAPSPQPAPTAD